MIGQTLGHYQITAKLGEGGMGVVFKARDTHLDRFVALKVLPREKVADQDRKRRFVQEAKAASALNHPHIVHIYDIDQAEGTDFIAMEYVEGQTLDTRIGRRGMRLGEALRYAVQIADALAKAHAAGIVHRDLKPTNIMVSADGLVKVLDFGLAKLTEPGLSDAAATTTGHAGEKPLTEAGVIVGTVAYMSPELAEGKAVDARSDIFSLGSVLYELVTGQQPFQGPSKLSTLSAILKEEPKPPSTITPAIPAELERLINRCLRKDPAKRFQHMDDVKVALEELKEESDSGTLAAAGPVARSEFRWGWAVGLAAAAVTLAAAGWVWLTRWQVAPAEPPMAAVPLTSFAGREAYPSFSPDGNQIAFAWSGERDDNFDIYVQVIGSGGPLRRTTDPASDSSPAWSPDGKLIAFLRRLGSGRLAVFVMPPVSGAERKLAEVQSESQTLFWETLTWHPEGAHLAIVDGGAVFLLSTETGERRQLTTPPQGAADRNPAFSPDGRQLAFSRGAGFNNAICVLSVDEGFAPQGEPTELAAGTSSLNFAVFPAWTADGREIVFAAGPVSRQDLWRVPVADPGTPQRLGSVGEGGSQPALSRDGRRLAYSRASADTNIYSAEVTDGGITERVPVRLIASSLSEGHPKFSPDGTKIAFESDRSGSPQVWICNADGSNPTQMTFFDGPVTGTPRWSPDGQQIVFDSRPEGQSGIFTVGVTGGKPRRLTASPAQDTMPSWSWDGKRIYFDSTRSLTSEVWRVPGPGAPAPVEPIQVTRQGGAGPVESPDGKFVYYARALSLWRIPIEGGEETRVLDSLVSSFGFEVTAKGIYFIPRAEAVVRFLDFRSKTIRTVTNLEQPWGDLTVSPDGRTILFSKTDTRTSDILLVEKFR